MLDKNDQKSSLELFVQMSLNHLYCFIWAFHLVDFGNSWSLYQKSKIHIVYCIMWPFLYDLQTFYSNNLDLEVFLSLKCKKDDRNNVFD